MRPAPALIAALLLAALLGATVSLGWLAWPAWATLLAVLAVIAAFDVLQLRALPDPQFERELAPVLPVGVEREVRLRLRNLCARPIEVELHDMHPLPWQVGGLPLRLQVAAGRGVECAYRVTPLQRGEFGFAGCQLRLLSPWRLWTRRRTLAGEQRVRVYPNFAPLAKLALVGTEQASRVVGAHLRRRRGEGTEFHQLREYRVGDSLRQLDWKASQRARKLISREYQDERNQQLLLVLDCGRRMLAHDDGLSHFDHALNAALVLAHIALRQGDAVGLLAVGAELRHLPPQRGLGCIDRLLEGLYDLQPQAVATDYLEAATQLASRQSRRALVVILSNARDEDVDDLALAVAQLRSRHLVCVASLREAVLDAVPQRPVHDLPQALLHAGVAHYLESRQRTHEALRLRGCDVLDVTCAQLPSALVEHYLAVKRAARL